MMSQFMHYIEFYNIFRLSITLASRRQYGLILGLINFRRINSFGRIDCRGNILGRDKSFRYRLIYAPSAPPRVFGDDALSFG